MIENKIEHSVLVTIHDQTLLMKFIERGRFSKLASPVMYMFVGMGDVDQVEDASNVIVA